MRFEFPDSADFPVRESVVFPHNTNHAIPKFAHLPADWDTDLSSLMKIVSDFGELNGFGDGEKIILHKQFKRISKAAYLYFNRRSPGESELTETGIATRLADTSKICAFFKGDVDHLMAQPDKANIGIMEVDRAIVRSDSAAKAIVQDFLFDVGLLEEQRKYVQRDLSVVQMTVHVSKETDKHLYQTFRDCDSKTKLYNLHVDPKPGTVKSIIYLKDVAINDGPFSWVKGSHLWDVDEVERIFAWGNSTGNYCHTPAHRKVMNAFPKRFRKNAIMGSLYPDGSKMSDFFLKNLTRITSDVANVMSFDPAFGIHHGGHCYDGGVRANLQIVLK